MRVVLIAFFIVAVIYSAQSAPKEDFLAKLNSAKENCKTDDPAKDEETFRNVWGLRSLPESDSEKCFIACLMKDFGAFTDGKFNVEAFHEISENRWNDAGNVEKSKEIDELCVKIVTTEGKDECVAAHEILKCFFDKTEEMGLGLTAS